jgi:hypothetical protein
VYNLLVIIVLGGTNQASARPRSSRRQASLSE